MASKVFLDADFLLDFLLQRAEYENARQILSLGIAGDFQLCTTPSVLHITAYGLTKTYGSKKAKSLILTLLTDMLVIDCDHKSALLAFNSAMEDTEDALQHYAAPFGLSGSP